MQGAEAVDREISLGSKWTNENLLGIFSNPKLMI